MSGENGRGGRGSEHVLFVAVLLCVICAFFMMDYVPDDSYISFRYAENLVDGHGLRFNPSEQPVEGYSNLLWILFCALLYALGLSLPAVVPTAGVLLSIFNVTLLWELYRRRGLEPLQMLFPLLVLASSGPVIMYAVSGMEMPLYAFLFLLMLYFLDTALSKGRLVDYGLLSFSCLLLSLCRPEGAAAFPIVAFSVLWLKRRKTERSGDEHWRRNLAVSFFGLVICVGLYHVWRVSYFGEWLPTPLLSKAGGGHSVVSAWGENLRHYFVRHMYYTPPFGYYFVTLFILSYGGLRLSSSLPAQKLTEAVTVVVVTAYALIYFNFNDWMPGMRYYSAYVAAMLLPAVYVQKPFFAPQRKERPMVPFWIIGLAAIALNAGTLAELRVIAHISETSNQKCTVPLGKWLKANLPSDALLAVSDVGAIPYYSGLETIDIHPESLTDIRIAKNGFSIDYIEERNPDVVIIPSRSLLAAKFYPEHFEMVADKRFERYRLVGVSRSDWFNDRCYWVYVKTELPDFTDEQMVSFPYGLGSVIRTYK